ncbi:MAG TPA: hypothetical protein PKE30_09325, partial [Niabella sp.]|nr:hypothetical protein [Niabella sp.]
MKQLTCVLVVLAGIAGFKPLNEPTRHHPGSSLAAQYPNDVGIEQDPDVLYAEKFNEAYIALLKITPTVNSVNNLISEEDELEFIKAFRELMRLKNTMSTFANFDWEDLAMPEQLFEN